VSKATLSIATTTRRKIKISNSLVVPQEFQFLLDMNFANFFEPTGESWKLDFVCKGCRKELKQWEREDHFNEHKRNRSMLIEASRVAATLALESGNGEVRVDVCVNCGNTFEQERKRGRPRKQCFDCLPPKE